MAVSIVRSFWPIPKSSAPKLPDARRLRWPQPLHSRWVAPWRRFGLHSPALAAKLGTEAASASIWPSNPVFSPGVPMPLTNVNHALNRALTGLRQIYFALCLRDLGLKQLALLACRACELRIQRIELRLEAANLLIHALLGLQHVLFLRRRSALRGRLRRRSYDGIGFRAGEVKRGAHNLIGELPIIRHEHLFARIARQLLVRRHLAIPTKSLVEERNDARGVQRDSRCILCLGREESAACRENAQSRGNGREDESISQPRFKDARRFASHGYVMEKAQFSTPITL